MAIFVNKIRNFKKEDLTDTSIVKYIEHLEQFGIQRASICKYCNIVDVTTQFASGKNFREKTIGFPHSQGEGNFEVLRTYNGKIQTQIAGCKGITLLSGGDKTQCCVFDGFVSFLKIVGTKPIVCDVVVLNGLPFAKVYALKPTYWRKFARIIHYTSKSDSKVAEVVGSAVVVKI